MKKLFKLEEKDLEKISGGNIEDIIVGGILGLPGGATVINVVDGYHVPIDGTVACCTTAIASSLLLMGAGIVVEKGIRWGISKLKGKGKVSKSETKRS